MKEIKIPNFSIEIQNDILEEYYNNMTDDEIVNKIVDEMQSNGLYACFNYYEVKNYEE